MASEVLEDTQRPRTTASRRAGIVDGVLAFVDRLPGPAAVTWAGIGIALAVIGHMATWLSTNRPLGVIHDDVAMPALIFAWFGWLAHTLNRVARATFDEFRPALDEPDSEARYRDELTRIPDGYAVLSAIGAIVIVSFAYYLGVRPLRVPGPPEIELVSTPLWGMTAAALGVVVLHTARQLRIVSRLSAIARTVDIFKPGPINAFSRLTAVSAIGLIAFVVVWVLYTPDQPIAYVVQEGMLLLVAAASFVLPLRVMHARLVSEKQRLESACQDRLKTVLARIHEHVEGNDLERAEQLNYTLTAVLAERDLLAKLHTWPWSAGTFRGFASALLLPIALILFTQVIDRVI